LQGAREAKNSNYRRELHFSAGRHVCRNDAGSNERHWCRRTGDLDWRASQQCGNDAQDNSTVQSSGRPQSRGNAKREAKWQRYDAGSYAAKNIATRNREP
jgi:hypothetical protein